MELSKMKNNHSWGAALVIFVCGLLIYELILRLFVYNINNNQIFNSELQKNQFVAGTLYFNATEGYGQTYFVAADEIATPFSTGTSILVFGDSFTEGFQVNDDEKYVSVTEKILHERGIDADLHNFGSGNQSLADHLWLFKHIFQQYQPKIVVLQLNITDFIVGYDRNKIPVNYFIKQSDGSIQFEHKTTELDQQSVLLRFLNQTFSLFSYGYIRFHRFQMNILEKYSTPPDQKKLILSLDDKESILEKISIFKQELGNVKLVIIASPIYPKIDKNEIILDDLRYYEFIAILRSVPDIIVLDPSNEFVEAFKNNRCPSGFSNSYPCTGHWNKEGHEIVGRLLADELQRIMK